ncbi:hypothetical protein ACFP3I_16280 [Chryseobacterium arachidis]|uniref:hypothetical protein n=1 Tax=Chryseobacterium arachidis TaxID=1416778 RepID=UPI0036116F5F
MNFYLADFADCADLFLCQELYEFSRMSNKNLFSRRLHGFHRCCVIFLNFHHQTSKDLLSHGSCNFFEIASSLRSSQ